MIKPHEWLNPIYRSPEHLGDRSGYVRLDRNERIPTFSPELYQALLATLDPECITSYPDPEPLYQRLSTYLKVPREQLMLTPGSDGGIKLAFQAYVSPGDRVVMPEPTYAMYPVYTQMFGATGVSISYNEDLMLEPSLVMAYLDQRPRLLALANPGQPVGTVISPQDLRSILRKALERDTLTIVDEAYFPFYPETALRYLPEFPNLVVLRTFSKAAGLAGLRLGYAVASVDIAENLRKVRAAYDINGVAICLGQFMLEHPAVIDDYVRQVATGKKVLRAGCGALGLRLPTSYTNFQLIGFPPHMKAGEVITALKNSGYIVRGPMDSYPLFNFIRVSVGPPEVMEGFVSALRRVVDDLGARG